MSNTQTAQGSKIVRRTHTSGSLTIREASIVTYLLAKLHGSPAPAGFKADKKSISTAFGQVGAFVNAIFDEARANIPALKKLAMKGDDEAKKELATLEEAFAKMEKDRVAGKFDQLSASIEIVRKQRVSKVAKEAKPAAAKASGKPGVKKATAKSKPPAKPAGKPAFTDAEKKANREKLRAAGGVSRKPASEAPVTAPPAIAAGTTSTPATA